MQTGAALFLVFIVLQRLSELMIARINTRRLMAQGAYEVGAGHYPAMVLMHSTWILCLVVFGHDSAIAWGWLAAFIVLQALRIWILAALGRRWTTRIIILPQPLVKRGPFRYLRHPNYMLVVAEVIVAPMVLGLVWVAVIFTVLNAAMLYVRFTAEERALSPHRG
ncbi:methyltransferase [Roseovarius nanhaiticus]|uniref:Methyltransferase n=1 Tax=Roseovarius nanhaiticus TaxID=573024 RepID=A0A1N7ELF4_9RHOB|nr:isoprenylcysteine carboxylmethyltransferase family protein [Roseovarius nanhaiticus]SEK72052.1 methyltransferase [Roseovarius nanhaiticus]SIR88917.1 methyltransferase [Roseovarius nanhaiticus]